jgi:sulfate adenylyltransferase large subunit
VDARLGVLQQSRRHAYIASLLGIPHLLVCINKMDLVGYDQQVYDRICRHFREFAEKLRFKDVTFVPISALEGDNVVDHSERTSWYDGESVLSYLENVPIAFDKNLEDFRYPIQVVVRPNLDYRGFGAQIASGKVRKGDEVIALPSGKQSRVRSIDTFEGELEEAFTPMGVALRLEDEIDVSRGDMLTDPKDMPRVGRTFDADLVWMAERPLDPQKSYIIKHTTQTARIQIDSLHCKTDMDTLEEVDADTLQLNDIGRATITCHRALYYDPYTKNRATGSFILIDSLTNNTVAAGMIRADEQEQDLDEALRELRAGSALTPKTQVSPQERHERMGQAGATVWLTGLPGSGRWTLAYALERRLFDLGRTATVIDPTGEDLRSMISAAKACTDAGLVTICAFPSYHRTDRTQVRERLRDDRFIEVYVNTDEALCRERRPDASFEGFEPPEEPDVTVALHRMRIEEAVKFIVHELEQLGQIEEK